LIEIFGFSTATPHETWDGLGVGADKLTREVSADRFSCKFDCSKKEGFGGTHDGRIMTQG